MQKGALFSDKMIYLWEALLLSKCIESLVVRLASLFLSQDDEDFCPPCNTQLLLWHLTTIIDTPDLVEHRAVSTKHPQSQQRDHTSRHQLRQTSNIILLNEFESPHFHICFWSKKIYLITFPLLAALAPITPASRPEIPAPTVGLSGFWEAWNQKYFFIYNLG